MSRSVKKFVVLICLVVGTCSVDPASGDGIGDFFERIGRTISKFRKPTPTPTPAKKPIKRVATGTAELNKAAPSTSLSPPATPTPTPVDIRPALLAPPSARKRDVPYGIAVPAKPGLVISPYAPEQGYVDISAFPSSTEVLDPFTGKIFRTP
jgi:hypothetical protein